ARWPFGNALVHLSAPPVSASAEYPTIHDLPPTVPVSVPVKWHQLTLLDSRCLLPLRLVLAVGYLTLVKQFVNHFVLLLLLLLPNTFLLPENRKGGHMEARPAIPGISWQHISRGTTDFQ